MTAKRKDLSILLLGAVVSLGLGFHVSAQDFPNPKPTEGHKLFAEDVGTWDAVVKMYLAGPAAPPVEYKGVEVSEVVCGGLFARATFKGKFGERDFEGHGLMGFDPETKEYTGTWVDNFTTTPTQTKGTYDAGKKVLTIFNTATGPDGTALQMKQVTTYLDAGNKKLEHFLLLDGSEIKLMEIISRKRKE